MDPNTIIKDAHPTIPEARSGINNPAAFTRESLQESPPMAQLAQTAPSLDHPVHEVRREIKILNKKGELALKLLAALKQKNLEDLSTRNQIFKILKARNESAQTLWAHVYESRDEDAIRIVEETLYAILHAPVCIGSKPSRGIFQLLEIIQPDQMGSVTAYIQDCMRLLADLPILVFRQVSLYFAYGFLSQNETILEAISTFVKSQDAEVQAQLESKIQLIFNYLLNDLGEAYCRAYFTESSVYNPHLLAACKTYPVLVQEGYAALLGHFLREASQGYLIKLLILPTPDHSCFLDLIYSKLNPTVSISLPREFLQAFNQLEDWFHRDRRCAYLIPIFRNLQLPNLFHYLLRVPLEILGKEGRLHYLLLSICLKHLEAIHRFKGIRIDTEAKLDYLQIVIIRLFQDLFDLDAQGGFLKRPLEESLFNVKTTKDSLRDALDEGISQESAVGSPSKELFFKILESLKPLNVWICPPLIAILLSNSLKHDIKQKPSSSMFDYVLGCLMRLGFDLHFTESVKHGNLIFEALDLQNVDLVHKLIELGVNPFLINKDGFSFFRIEKLLSQILDKKDFYAEWKAHDRSVLKLTGLDQHPFLATSFQSKLVKTGEGLDARDEQCRTPLMLWTQCNQDIQPLLKYVSIEVLEAKDKTGRDVIDYARKNNDTMTLALLEKHKKKLKHKSGFRKLASRLVSKSQNQAHPIQPEPIRGLKKSLSQRPGVGVGKNPSQAQMGASRVQPSTHAQAQLSTAQPSTAEPSTASTICLDYDQQTGQMTSSYSYSKTEIRKEAEEKISKAEKKQKAKEEKARKKKEEHPPVHTGRSQKNLYEKAKHTVEAVGQVLETVRNISSHPGALLERWVGRISVAKHLEQLAKAPTALNLGKAKPVHLLEDGSQAGAFRGLRDLAQAVIEAKIKEVPQGHILETLGDIEEAIKRNPQKKIHRYKILEALQWVLGGDIEEGKGSHMNLRFKGGGLTIPRNQKDGSENAGITYIRQAADRLEWNLRALLLGYDSVSSPDSDSTVSAEEESSE